MNIFIEQLQKAHSIALYQFEVENRAYFEQSVPSRGDDYYHIESFKEILKNLLLEQAARTSLFYVIKNEDTIVGRINIVDIDPNEKIGHLGYRVGQAFAGKGIANQALQLLLQLLDNLDIHQLQAVTTNNNIASQKILEKNGFTKTDESSETFEMNNETVHFVYYSFLND